MTVLVILFAGLLGLAVGSFLNVVIWRLPRGESVVSPASACPACGHPIRARDNVPVLGWLLLRGRCRDCDEPISARYPLVEAATGVVFAVVAAVFGPVGALPAFLYLGAISVALALIDIDVRRLPDAIVLPSYLVAGALLALSALTQGDWSVMLRAVIGMAAMYAGYLAISTVGRLVYGSTAMGGGDVKLAGVLGLYLGFLGWKELVTGAFLAFLVGGLVGIAIMALGGRKVKVPFGPYMLAGAWLGILVGPVIADWYLRVSHLA